MTGVNGIRKTTSIYEAWFQSALAEAIRAPSGEVVSQETAQQVPTGGDSFFRQLDYVIATVANADFERLYEIRDVKAYSEAKEAIFARYRTLAEMVGVLLLDEARSHRANVMLETSGRDVAMFQYVDHFFPDDSGTHLESALEW